MEHRSAGVMKLNNPIQILSLFFFTPNTPSLHYFITPFSKIDVSRSVSVRSSKTKSAPDFSRV